MEHVLAVSGLALFLALLTGQFHAERLEDGFLAYISAKIHSLAKTAHVIPSEQ